MPQPSAPSSPEPPQRGPTVRWAAYLLSMFVAAAGTVAVLLLMQNIFTRQREAEQIVFELVELDEETVDPELWGKNFPRQYDSYRRTVDTERTRHGGSEAMPEQKLDKYPLWRILFDGYPFSVDHREARGHAYMLSDADMTRRLEFDQPGACLHCHASVVPAYRQAGRQAGVPDAPGFNWPQVMKGFEEVCGMTYQEARTLVDHPVSCIDCHDPDTLHLRITRPAFLEGIQALARSDDPLPHLPSIQRWRDGSRDEPYDPNRMATRQEMRSFVCAQCHVEYYFEGENNVVTFPWHQGLKVEQIEQYFDDQQFHDWTHGRSGAPLLKAQHPEFEMWSQGIHARSGVSCADCHMPYQREGAIKVSDHQVRSPMLNIAHACQTCHRQPEEELKARVDLIQQRTRSLMARGEQAAVDLVETIEEAIQAGVDEQRLATARQLHRQAQWRLDFVFAENSLGFHAPQEAARILGEAIDLARQGQVEVLKARQQPEQEEVTD